MKYKQISNAILGLACIMPLIGRIVWWTQKDSWLTGEEGAMVAGLSVVCFMIFLIVLAVEYREK